MSGDLLFGGLFVLVFFFLVLTVLVIFCGLEPNYFSGEGDLDFETMVGM